MASQVVVFHPVPFGPRWPAPGSSLPTPTSARARRSLPTCLPPAGDAAAPTTPRTDEHLSQQYVAGGDKRCCTWSTTKPTPRRTPSDRLVDYAAAAGEDVLAFTPFPEDVWSQIPSNKPAAPTTRRRRAGREDRPMGRRTPLPRPRDLGPLPPDNHHKHQPRDRN